MTKQELGSLIIDMAQASGISADEFALGKIEEDWNANEIADLEPDYLGADNEFGFDIDQRRKILSLLVLAYKNLSKGV